MRRKGPLEKGTLAASESCLGMADQFATRRTAPVSRSRPSHGRLIAAAAVALAIVAGAVVWRATGAGPVTPKREAVAVRNPVLDELVASTKALEMSQQQAIDQLQVLQDSVSAQQAETRRASDQVAQLNNKLETLRQSFANIAAPPVEDKSVEAAPAKPTQSAEIGRKVRRSAVRSRGRSHRVGSRSSRAVAARK